MDISGEIKRTELYDFHRAQGAKMVPFAGYQMPVQYAAGIIKEHLHTRSAAGLFDISHMGQIRIEGGANIREQVEAAVPGDLQALASGGLRYSFLLSEQGGVLDDLMIMRPVAADRQNSLDLIVNASTKEQDFIRLQALLPDCQVTMVTDRALLALQGPQAAAVLARFCDAPQLLKFMQADDFIIKDIGSCQISRSGYTGEDGFELSVPSSTVAAFAEMLCQEPEVMPIGLGARDSLRLEAGLCLYGHDLDPQTTPIEAGLIWSIAKRRRTEGGFVGAAKVQEQIVNGVTRRRVGIRPEGRAIAREHTEIQDAHGKSVGMITSGGFSPSLDGPIAMGYVDSAYAAPGTTLTLIVRGKPLPAQIIAMPFVPHRYFKEN